MTPHQKQQFQRASELFAAVRTLPPADREAALSRACCGDLGLHAEVRSLLAQDLLAEGGDPARTADPFLAAPAMVHAAAAAAAALVGGTPLDAPRVTMESDWPPPTVPPDGAALAAPAPCIDDGALPGYRRIEILGEGGMGVVWRAEQVGTRRVVALKTIGASFAASDRVKRRFEREVELAASLEHPFVARIYDSGLSQGRYFCAMELVDGTPVTRYAADHQLSRVGRVALMRRVAQGVGYAHEHAVIHRDLKPSNILVCEDGTPKLLDFGLAKLVRDGAAEGGLTLSGDIVGTPSYMPPEQARGESASADTRGDVWSLGVVLFELLTGALPHESGGSYVSVLRRVADEEPRRPRAVAPDLDSELEAILLKCLARDAGARYGNAADLAADLGRYLDGEPIAARPATALYLLRKGVARHKARFAVGAAAALLLAAGAFVYVIGINRERGRTWEAKLQADRNTQLAVSKAEQAVLQRAAALDTIRSFVLTAQRELSRGAADAKLRESLLAIARGGLDRVNAASTPAADAAAEGGVVDRDSAVATVVMGDIARSAGDLGRARSLYREAAGQYERLAGQQPHPPAALLGREHAVAQMRLARVELDLGQPGPARRALDAAQRSLEPLLGSDPENPTLRRDRWLLAVARGELLLGEGTAAAALRSFDEARVLVNAGPADPADGALVQRRVAAACEMLARPADPATCERAVAEAGAAVRLDRERLAADPDAPQLQADHANSLVRSAKLRLLTGDPAGARRDAEEAYATLTGYVAAHPGDLAATLATGDALLVLLRTSGVVPEGMREAAREYLRVLDARVRPQGPVESARLDKLLVDLSAALTD